MKCKHETYYDYDTNNDLCEDCGLLIKKDRQYEKGDYIDFKIYGYPVNTNRSVQNLKQNLRKYKFPEHIVNQAIYWFRLDQNKKWSKKVMSQYLAKAAWQFGNSLTLNDIEQSMKIPITQIPKELTIPYKEEKSPSNRVQKKYPEECYLEKFGGNLTDEEYKIFNKESCHPREGLLIVGKRPSEATMKECKVDPFAYGPCTHCYIYLLKRDIWRHKCKLNDNQKLSKKKSTMVLPLASENAYSEKLGIIVEGLRNDIIGRVCKSDQLIMELGRKMCANHSQDPDQQQFIRERMRRAGKILKSPDADMKYFLKPTRFNELIDAVRKISGFDSTTNTFATLSLPNKLSNLLKDLITIIESEALQTRDLEGMSEAQALYKLIEINWKEVSVPANRQLQEDKFHKPQLLPLSEDICGYLA
ncbi:hypothetical protein CAPTEDRAFT_189318 [Capitella teleta]|uniref:Uncharacterized protein n=1 Tax=Capitella teleta TaxID=283909 RepID=R7UTH5_CAPTE|nr:hypothetical protein CAPTEDRAFT_189318 [Capitella teleta]|eukprot:ELU06686.1 hypothetical protein CAPTEDRAFT_189318 [Capitella teleta]